MEKNLKAIALKSGTRQAYPLSPCLTKTVLEDLSKTNKTTKGNRGDTNCKGRHQSILICRWYDSIYINDLKILPGNFYIDKHFLTCVWPQY